MHFDGKTALFVGSVRSRIDDGEEKTEVRCKKMGVTLNKPFSFSEDRKGEEQPEVESIDCYEGVEFDSDSTLDDALVEVRRGVFAQLHFDKISGKSLAHGPGLLRVWRHNENGQSGLSQFANVRSNSPPQARRRPTGNTCKSSFWDKWRGISSRCSRPNRKPGPPHRIRKQRRRCWRGNGLEAGRAARGAPSSEPTVLGRQFFTSTSRSFTGPSTGRRRR